MTLTNKTRLGKRRLEMQDLRKEKQITTSKKHDKKCLEANPNKDFEDLKQQLKDLQEKYDRIRDENTKHVEKIKHLESKVKSLEEVKEMFDSQPKIARTTTGGLLLFCNECEFPADDLYDLGQHMYEYHTEGNENKIVCHYCDETFETKDEVMKHRKKAHKEKVKQCIYFSAGKCHYGDELCWFNHSKSNQNPLDTESEIKCKHCDKTFKLRAEFMKHRKRYHPDFVPVCNNFTNGNCEYPTCWFKHNENEDLFIKQNDSKRFEDILENFSGRLTKIEQSMTTEKSKKTENQCNENQL